MLHGTKNRSRIKGEGEECVDENTIYPRRCRVCYTVPSLFPTEYICIEPVNPCALYIVVSHIFASIGKGFSNLFSLWSQIIHSHYTLDEKAHRSSFSAPTPLPPFRCRGSVWLVIFPLSFSFFSLCPPSKDCKSQPTRERGEPQKTTEKSCGLLPVLSFFAKFVSCLPLLA